MLHVFDCCEQRGWLARLVLPQSLSAREYSREILNSHYTLLSIPDGKKLLI